MIDSGPGLWKTWPFETSVLFCLFFLVKESYFVRSTEIVRFDVQSGVISKCGLLAVACTVGRDLQGLVLIHVYGGSGFGTIHEKMELESGPISLLRK